MITNIPLKQANKLAKRALSRKVKTSNVHQTFETARVYGAASVAGGVGIVHGVMSGKYNGYRIDMEKDILPEDWVPDD